MDKVTVTTKYNPDCIEVTTMAHHGLSVEHVSTKTLNLQNQAERDALIALGWTPPGEMKKIKMTKKFPGEAGYYFWSDDKSLRSVTIVLTNSQTVKSFVAAGGFGGYWAKADQSMFEFEDDQ